MLELEALSNNLKEIRHIMELSQIDLAANCGISVEILSLMERQKTDPKLSTIQKVAAYIGCEVIDLLKPKRVEYLKYEYSLRKGVIKSEEGTSYPSYGITITNAESGEQEDIYPDLFFDKEIADAFIEICNSQEITPEDFHDAVEDILP